MLLATMLAGCGVTPGHLAPLRAEGRWQHAENAEKGFHTVVHLGDSWLPDVVIACAPTKGSEGTFVAFPGVSIHAENMRVELELDGSVQTFLVVLATGHDVVRVEDSAVFASRLRSGSQLRATWMDADGREVTESWNTKGFRWAAVWMPDVCWSAGEDESDAH